MPLLQMKLPIFNKRYALHHAGDLCVRIFKSNLDLLRWPGLERLASGIRLASVLNEYNLNEI